MFSIVRYKKQSIKKKNFYPFFTISIWFNALLKLKWRIFPLWIALASTSSAHTSYIPVSFVSAKHSIYDIIYKLRAFDKGNSDQFETLIWYLMIKYRYCNGIWGTETDNQNAIKESDTQIENTISNITWSMKAFSSFNRKN